LKSLLKLLSIIWWLVNSHCFFNRERNLFIGPVDTRQEDRQYASGPSASLPGWQRGVRRAAGQAGAKKGEQGRSGRAEGRKAGRKAGRQAGSGVRGRRTEADSGLQRANEREIWVEEEKLK
jgi:hypothetical protein